MRLKDFIAKFGRERRQKAGAPIALRLLKAANPLGVHPANHPSAGQDK
jgi:hypothetical protein